MTFNMNRKAKSDLLSKLILLILIGILIYASYFLYLNIPREAQQLNVEIQNPPIENIPLMDVKQFYPNMKFNHNEITYLVNGRCNEQKKERMNLAFDEISYNLPLISFKETFENPDIKITCGNSAEPGKAIDGKHFIAGEGGAKEIIKTERYSIITNGEILLYENPDIESIKCDYPNVEIHEVMHVFGFDHINDKRSIMYPLIESCEQKLDSSIIKTLNKIYSQPNLPDLYFEHLKIVKKGRYLDFNLTMKNSGSIDSEDFTLTILDDNTIISERDFTGFKYGEGINFYATNLKLKHLNPKEIKFVIDKNNQIKEIDENNNEAKVDLE